MNFGDIGGVEFLFVLLLWCLPVLLLVWFIKTLSGMASSLRDIAARLQALERAIRDATPSGPSNFR